MSLAALYVPIAADMQAVDAVIRDRLHSDVVLIRQVAEYIIGAGGKRLRPALVLFSAGALGYRGSDHRELAAVVERANRAIKQIFDAEKYDLILQEVVFAGPRVDITEKVIKALNAQPAK